MQILTCYPWHNDRSSSLLHLWTGYSGLFENELETRNRTYYLREVNVDHLRAEAEQLKQDFVGSLLDRYSLVPLEHLGTTRCCSWLGCFTRFSSLILADINSCDSFWLEENSLNMHLSVKELRIRD